MSLFLKISIFLKNNLADVTRMDPDLLVKEITPDSIRKDILKLKKGKSSRFYHLSFNFKKPKHTENAMSSDLK